MAEPSAQQLRALLAWIFDNATGPERDLLAAQAATATARSGSVTMLEIDVADTTPSTTQSYSPWPVDVSVTDSNGTPTGGLLLWVESGRLTTLEHYWFTDEPPTELPPPDRLLIDRE